MADVTALPDRANVFTPPPVLWIVLFLIGLGFDYIAALPFMPDTLPALWIGGAIWLTGAIIVALAVRQFRRAGTSVPIHTPTTKIVETGLYAVSRNPIYIGALTALLGAAIATDSLWVLAMLIPFAIIIRHGVIAREEAYLERKFGDVYVAYKGRVRRWI
jgi:protein-S-isoprenylcysteine O-methyltransferase Ste14